MGGAATRTAAGLGPAQSQRRGAPGCPRAYLALFPPGRLMRLRRVTCTRQAPTPPERVTVFLLSSACPALPTLPRARVPRAFPGAALRRKVPVLLSWWHDPLN